MRMIERAAKAAYLDINPDWPGLEWENLAPSERRGYEGSMRAAVKAMMEPSEAMLQAAQKAQRWSPDLGPDIGAGQDVAKWRVMLRAILDEEE